MAAKDMVERFQQLKDFYLAALHFPSECNTPSERKCFVQEMRAITNESKSVTVKYRNVWARNFRLEQMRVSSLLHVSKDT
jgi:hypothetical protein